MFTLNYRNTPLQVFGVPFFEETQEIRRLPDDLISVLPHLKKQGRRCTGARVGFRTNAETFTVRVTLKSSDVDPKMSLISAHSVIVMEGERNHAHFLGLTFPPNYHTTVFEETFSKPSIMEDITLWLPRNEPIENIEVMFPDGALVEPPTPYRYGPVLFYGSSITEGACASNVTTNYVALLSRWLDLDFYNFGFTGNARGELEMADYLNTIDFSVFVMDYDHNAATPAQLQATHGPFYRRIREKHPHTPIIMMSRPPIEDDPDDIPRYQIVKQTYEQAKANGDEHVYYVDAKDFFKNEDIELCTMDRCHPNDVGFLGMAKAIRPVMERVLASLQGK